MRRLLFFSGGILCGLMIGATVALLLTPESGDALRVDTKDRFDGMLAEAHRASEKKRIELETQLAAMTSPVAHTAVKPR